MNTIKMHAYSWIAESMGTSANPKQAVNTQVKEETTLLKFLTEMATQYSDFKKLVFDPDTGKLSDQMIIILNGRLIQEKELKSTQLNDKDKLILSPILIGG